MYNFGDIKSHIFGLLMALGVTEPVASPEITMDPGVQLALVECYRSGQIDERAWQEHLRECPELEGILHATRARIDT